MRKAGKARHSFEKFALTVPSLAGQPAVLWPRALTLTNHCPAVLSLRIWRQGGRCHPQLLIFTTQNNFSHFSTNFYQQKLDLKCYVKQQSQEQPPKYSITVLSVDIKTFFFCYYSVFTLENIPQNTICMEQIPERLKTTVIPGACCLPARAPCW